MAKSWAGGVMIMMVMSAVVVGDGANDCGAGREYAMNHLMTFTALVTTLTDFKRRKYAHHPSSSPPTIYDVDIFFFAEPQLVTTSSLDQLSSQRMVVC